MEHQIKTKGMAREKRPNIDEGMRNVILSRLFGESYATNPEIEGMYLGYIDGVIVEVLFTGFICSVMQRGKKFGAVKFGNLVMNKFFATRGLRCITEERINFDNTTCAHVCYDKESVDFCFWYRNKNKAA